MVTKYDGLTANNVCKSGMKWVLYLLR